MFLTAYFCSDERLNAGAFSSKVEACRTVKAVAVEQSHCGHLQCGGGRHQVLRQGPGCQGMSPPVTLAAAHEMPAGMPSRMVTVTHCGGRNKRKAVSTWSGACCGMESGVPSSVSPARGSDRLGLFSAVKSRGTK